MINGVHKIKRCKTALERPKMAYHKIDQVNKGKIAENVVMISCIGGDCKYAAYRFIDSLPCLWCNIVDKAVVNLFKCPNELWIIEHQ